MGPVLSTKTDLSISQFLERESVQFYIEGLSLGGVLIKVLGPLPKCIFQPS